MQDDQLPPHRLRDVSDADVEDCQGQFARIGFAFRNVFGRTLR